ncbi:hypothetical protein ACFX19_026021 [Malus domestica]
MDDDAHASLTSPLVLSGRDDERCEPPEEAANCDHQITTNTTTSFLKTFFNGLNALSGIGILSVPYALASGGWLSLILLFVTAAAAFYSGLLMQRSMDVDTSIKTYPDIGEQAFGKTGRIVLSIFMNIELYLVATAFLIIEGDNLHNLFPNMDLQLAASGFPVSGKQCFVMIAGLVVMPTVWLDNLSLLSYVSATGVFASAIILGSILWAGAFDGIGFHHEGSVPLNWNGIPTAVSLYVLCYCAHPVFPTLYTSMTNKRQFSNVLLLSFIVCTASYASMAVLGYLMFGSRVESQITLNLPTQKLSSKLAICTILLNPLSKYALMVTPILNAAKNRFPGQHNNKIPLSLLLSTALVISSATVALALPFFGYLMSLVGAFFSVMASLIIPCVCYLKISGTYRKIGCEMVIVWCIILIGVVVVIFGTYTSLLQIVQHL